MLLISKKESYGEFVYLDRYDSSHGFDTSLFEELEAYDISTLQKEYQVWLHNALAEGEKSMDEGKSISIDPFYSEENQARLRESIAQARSGRVHTHELMDCTMGAKERPSD